MLGLGLGLGITKGSIKGLIANLLSSLKSRAAYYENDASSRSTIKEVKDYGLLDKATILLTPTATSNARVHSVKTYTGEELVTNGDFATDSDWTLSSTFEIDNGKLHCVSDGSYQYAYQGNAFVVGNTYKITFDVIDYTSGSIRVRPTGQSGYTAASANGTYTQYFTATDTTLAIERDSACDLYVDNVSVIDVSSDFDFDRASSATRINSSGLVQDMQSITDPELVLNGDFEELGDELITNGSLDTNSGWTFVNGPTYNSNGYIDFNLVSGNARTDISVVQDKVYKVVYEIKNYQEGTIKFRLQGGTNTGGQQQSGNGIKTEYITCNDSSNDNFQFFGSSSFIGSLDNISIKQVNVDSEGNDIWSLGTGWSIEDGKLKSDGTINVSAFQEDVLSQSGNTYKIKFDVNVASGSLSTRVRMGDSTNGHTTVSNITSEGSYTLYATAVANQDNLNFTTLSDNTAVYTIDNVSVKDITFSTDVDLARINYDSNGDNGHILLEPTSTNLVGYSLPNDTNWSKGTNTTITENYAVSPDGTQNASRFVMPTGSGTYAYYQFTATSTTDHTLSFYAKNNGGDADVTMAFFAASQTKNITLTNEWQRFEFTTSITSGNAVQVGVDNITSVDMLIFGVQCEALPYATSYIPTLTGSTVTRATETLNGSGNSTLINSTEGVLYAEIAKLDDDADIKGISLGQTGTDVTINGITFYFLTSNLRARAYDSDYTQNAGVYFEATKSSISTNTFYKVAISWDSNGGKMYVDGALITPTRNLSGYGFAANYFNSLNFYRNSNDVFEGKVKALAVFNEALSDTELGNLTNNS